MGFIYREENESSDLKQIPSIWETIWHDTTGIQPKKNVPLLVKYNNSVWVGYYFRSVLQPEPEFVLKFNVTDLFASNVDIFAKDADGWMYAPEAKQ